MVKNTRFKRIYIEITNYCNMNCKFCPKTNRRLQYMEIENFKNIITKIKDYTNTIYLHVKGEPLLHVNLKEILEIAKQSNLDVVITTNGTMLKEKQEILENAKSIRQINISVHSFEQNIKKQNNYLYDVLNTVKNITDKNDIYISYRFWNMHNDDITKNEEHIQQICKSYNIESYEELKTNNYLKLKEKHYINIDNVFEWPNLNNKECSEYGYCYGLIDQLAILVDGTVVPCCLDQDGIISLGNILEESLKDILNKEKTKEIIKGFKENKLHEELCKKCTFRINKRK